MKMLLPAVALALFVALPLIPSASAEDAAKPATGEIQDLKQITGELPHDVLLGLLNNAGKQAAMAQGTTVLREKVDSRKATLKFKIDKIEKDLRRAEKQEGYRVKADQAPLREGGVSFKVYLWVNFSLTENDKAAALKKGNEISVTGKVTSVSLTGEKFIELHVDLSDATVVK